MDDYDKLVRARTVIAGAICGAIGAGAWTYSAISRHMNENTLKRVGMSRLVGETTMIGIIVMLPICAFVGAALFAAVYTVARHVARQKDKSEK